MRLAKKHLQGLHVIGAVGLGNVVDHVHLHVAVEVEARVKLDLGGLRLLARVQSHGFLERFKGTVDSQRRRGVYYRTGVRIQCFVKCGAHVVQLSMEHAPAPRGVLLTPLPLPAVQRN